MARLLLILALAVALLAAAAPTAAATPSPHSLHKLSARPRARAPGNARSALIVVAALRRAGKAARNEAAASRARRARERA